MGTFLNLAIGNDRPNVSLVVRAIQNPMNTFSDLDFLIPARITDPQQVKQTFIYADQISSADGMEKRLYSIAPESFREAGIIRPYSTAYSVKYQTEVMAMFKAGIVRILICTDAAGMVRQLLHNTFWNLKEKIGM